MRLNKIAVDNFRPFHRAVIGLTPGKITIVAGPNNSGKSSLFATLDLFADPSIANVRHVASADPARVRFTFDVSQGIREAMFSDSPEGGSWLRSRAFTEVEFHFEELADAHLMSIAAIYASDYTGKFVLVAQVNWSDARGGGKVRALDLGRWVKAHGPRDRYELESTVSGDVAGVLNPGDIHLKQSMPSLHDALDVWRSTFYHFQPVRPGTFRRRPLAATATLLPSGENLPEVLLYFATQRLPAWNLIQDFMYDALPEIGLMQTPAEGSEVEVSFEDPHLGRRFNLKDLGTGVEQLLLTAVVGITHPEASLVVVEEPETHLHPSAQRKLLAHMRNWVQQKQFMLSTHSSVFLDRAPAQSSVWLVERREGWSSLSERSEDLPSVLTALGVRPSDVLSAERILIVEGPSDVAIMELWFAESGGYASVAIVQAGGGDIAWHVDRLTEWMAEADQLGRSLLMVKDRDELRDHQVAALERTGAVCILQRRELENYLLDASAIADVLKELSPKRIAPSADEITELMRGGADTLKPEVVLKRTVNDLGTLRILARSDLNELRTGPITWQRLANLIRRNASQLPSDELVAELWEANEHRTSQEWERNWARIAPGSGILENVFRHFGLTFSKKRDGLAIAERISPTAVPELPEKLLSFVRAPDPVHD